MREGLSFGVDWYPEQWDESRWERDVDRMRGFGVNVARIMEFAWPLVEPEPGRFDFSLFDRAIGLLASRSIGVILGTPTATFPVWLLERGGSVLQVSPEGRVRDFGTRRMGCFNSAVYREASARLVSACAEHFAGDARIVGWQIDNELGHEGSDRCVCDNCRAAWRLWLAARYGGVDAMNESWGNVFWGTSYARFDQVPVPRKQPASTFNPSLLLDYDRFMSDSAVGFAEAQIDILRPRLGPGCFVTTNLFPPPLSLAIDMERLTRKMDFASWDNYPVWGEQDEPYPYQFQSFVESYIRGLHGGRPFTVMEEFSGIQGNVCLGHLPPERQAALWTNQAIARGANRIVYFRWRTAPYGQEQLCYGLFDTDDEETERSRVLAENLREASPAFAPFASTPFESRACLLYSKDNARLLREQYLSEGLYFAAADWAQAGYDLELATWFAPFVAFNVNADVKSVDSVDLDDYALLSLPLYQMADPAFALRLDAWVRSGGTLVLGYRSGTRDVRNWNIGEPLPGAFAEMAGLRVRRFESLNKGKVGIRIGLLPAKGGVWADILEPTTAKAVAFYRDRGKFYDGSPCAAVNAHGKGRVWYLGTSLDPAGIFLLYRRILKEAGMKPRFLGNGVEMVERRTESGSLVRVVLNHTPRPRRALGRRIPAYGWTVIE
ncbi:MAG TPA: beta-galactosidase [Rectinemataceae bacterium]|nr:beta-galactosidase [Rectinemataceae bacterium]